MIKTVAIKNFRCFRDIQLPDCRRINLIVGRNASGKTTLLEAIYLALGASPELALRIRAWRGQDKIPVTGDQSSYEAIWRDLFYKFDKKNPISIEFHGSDDVTRSLAVSYESAPELVLPFGEDIRAAEANVPVAFVWNKGGKQFKVVPVISQGAIRIATADLPPILGSFMATHISFPHRQYADFFSYFSKQKKDRQIVELLKHEFPFVEDIGVELDSGGEPMLFAAVEHLPEKVPVGLLSYGVLKLVSILLSIARQPRGVCLIDEIETGFYFDRLNSIWALILDFARQYEVQLFAATHSRECLESAAQTAEISPEEFSVIRTVRKEGLCMVRQFDGKRFVGAMEEDIEVR